MGKEQELRATIETRNELAGFIEFINEDVPVIVRDLDAPAAILIDMNTRKVVGYRVYDPAPRRSSSDEAEVVATMLRSESETIFSKGWVPNMMGFSSTPLYASPSGVKAGVTEEQVETAARVIAERLGFNPKPGLFIEHREMARAALTAALGVGDEGMGGGTRMPETLARITARAEGAISHLRSVKWFNGLRGTNATTLERAISVIESQRDEILALNAYIDSLEADALRLALRKEAPDAHR